MRQYLVEYKEHEASEVKEIWVEAKNKERAYDKAVYIELLKENIFPYSAWVRGVIQSNGEAHVFNTHEGKRF